MDNQQFKVGDRVKYIGRGRENQKRQWTVSEASVIGSWYKIKSADGAALITGSRWLQKEKDTSND
jgi:hypothetical protein